MVRTLVIGIALLAPFSVFAQSACTSALPVTMTLSSDLRATVPSASLGFRAAMRNSGGALIPDARFSVSVASKESGAIIDRFVASQGFALLPGSDGKADFVWKTPSTLPSGTYTVTASLVTPSTTIADALSGKVQPSASTDIEVKGGVPQANISSVSVNGSAYRPDSVVRIARSSAQVVAATLNATTAPFKGTLLWRLYAPDATFEDAALDTATSSAELHPGTRVDVSYALTDTAQSGYYLEGILSDGKTNSYIDIWLSRDPKTFAELECGAPSGAGASGGGNTALVVGIVGVVVALGLVWELYEKRRG